MKTRILLFTAGGVLLCAHQAFAQKSQPWRHDWGAVESRIQVCPPVGALPVPMPRMAFDDFKCTSSGPINWLYWWGVVLDPNQVQLTKKYYIAIHSTVNTPCPAVAGEPCNPAQRLASWCVTPTYKYAGTDCLNRKVYRFRATLSPAFIQTTGQHYWLTICEIDQESARIGVEDFRWSGFRLSEQFPWNLCPAQLLPPPGAFCSIDDDCPHHTDLSFDLKHNIIGGVIFKPQLIDPNTLWNFELRPPLLSLGGFGNQPPLWVDVIDADEDGTYAVDPPDAINGPFMATIRGMGIGQATNTIVVQNGQSMGVNYANLHYADLNNDGLRNGEDVPLIVDGLLSP